MWFCGRVGDWDRVAKVCRRGLGREYVFLVWFLCSGVWGWGWLGVGIGVG
jgi:hypothetical protein